MHFRDREPAGRMRVHIDETHALTPLESHAAWQARAPEAETWPTGM